MDPKQKKVALAALVVLAIIVIGAFEMRRYKRKKNKSGFDGDSMNWPTASQMGAMADTYPYGNYAGHADMQYPTF
jgi:hypothetical protein